MADTKPKLNRAGNEEVEIDLVDLFAHFKQHIILIVVLAVAAALAAILITRFAITPKYDASSSIYVVSASANSALKRSSEKLG